MPSAIRIHATGGPEVLTWEHFSSEWPGAPGPGEVRLRQTAIGLNFIDVYHRTGLYPLPLPAVLGQEGAGIVEAVGQGVPEAYDLRPGDRVAYAPVPGAYAQVRLAPAERMVKLPDAISDETAAAMMLKGMTAHYLIRRTHRVQPGETILVHAAAGGVGLILCQWARALGATVIGTVSTEAKAELARAHGCEHVIFYNRERVPERVRQITGGAGVPVVYDSVGRDTFEGSLDSLAPMGLLASFGNASGPVPSFNPMLLMQKGSLFFTRAALMHHVARREDLLAAAAELFDVVAAWRGEDRDRAALPAGAGGRGPPRPRVARHHRIDVADAVGERRELVNEAAGLGRLLGVVVVREREVVGGDGLALGLGHALEEELLVPLGLALHVEMLRGVMAISPMSALPRSTCTSSRPSSSTEKCQWKSSSS